MNRQQFYIESKRIELRYIWINNVQPQPRKCQSQSKLQKIVFISGPDIENNLS